jgi:hypothetical protein
MSSIAAASAFNAASLYPQTNNRQTQPQAENAVNGAATPADQGATPTAATPHKGDASSTDNKHAHEDKTKTGKLGPEAQLSEDELREVQEMKARDQEVRAHEAAHLAAAGQHARGGVSFTYANGPDGRRYAVGGEVSIDTSPVANDPQATLQKANTIRAAAMAPAEPSSQDRSVAAEATQMAAQARQDIATEQAEAMKASRAETNSENEDAPSASENKASQAYQQVGGIENQSASSLKVDLMI